MDRNQLLLEIQHGSDLKLTDPLPDNALRDSKARYQAEQYQRSLIAKRHRKPKQTVGALIKLRDYRGQSDKGRDPKAAIRGGLIDAGCISQFFVPMHQDDVKDYERRMKNAISDLMRVLGHRFNPFYEKPAGTLLPEAMDLIAFWLIQLNARGKREETVMLPLVVDAPFGNPHMRVFIPRDTGTAELHPTLREGIMAAVNYGADFDKDGEMSGFFADALEKRNNGRPALLMLADRNLRRVYPELALDGARRISLYGALDERQHIRVARLRFSRYEEAPFCAPGTEMGKYQGLYYHSGYPNTFFSLHNVGERHQSIRRRKMNHPENPAANPSTVQIHMCNLQPGDDPAEWAGLAHRLRLESSHTDIRTVSPQPLHDAQVIHSLPLALGR